MASVNQFKVNTLSIMSTKLVLFLCVALCGAMAMAVPMRENLQVEDSQELTSVEENDAETYPSTWGKIFDGEGSAGNLIISFPHTTSTTTKKPKTSKRPSSSYPSKYPSYSPYPQYSPYPYSGFYGPPPPPYPYPYPYPYPGFGGHGGHGGHSGGHHGGNPGFPFYPPYYPPFPYYPPPPPLPPPSDDSGESSETPTKICKKILGIGLVCT
ncbi:uncharacterized protein Dere_GG22060 [Drosophila erecta]|uniref:Uncharacterized protein n=1 Tax=Drosophila erecta TaxID=7220 RepID=B3NK37_DROER|nr:uncharacterized protein Dere_GG22060 [Drosophila erecta]